MWYIIMKFAQVDGMNKTERLYAYVLRRRVVTSDELGEWASNELGKDYKYLYTKYITRLLAQGKLVRVTRGMYAARNLFPTDPYDHPDAPPNKYLVGSKLRESYFLGYHTALELHGCAHSVYYETHVVTLDRDKFKSFVHDREAFRSVITKDIETEVLEVSVLDQNVRVSSPSRTFVECVRRWDLCGGLEEVLKSLEGLEGVTPEGLDSAIGIYDYDILRRSVGFFLELMMAESPYYGHIPSEYIESLRERIGGTPSYYIRGEPSTLDQRWALYVPDYLDELMAGVH
jgi:predicted transcriptional regulator of viral defense system